MLTFTSDDRFNFRLRVTIAEGAKSYTLLLAMAGERYVCPLLYSIAISLNQGQKSLVGFRLFSKSFIDGFSQLLTMRGLHLLTEPFVIAVPRMAFRLLDDRVSMLKANDVTELCHGAAGAKKVPELVPAVNRRRIPDDVIVDVVFINVGADQESVLSL
jgi:hypothetical protein